ncbi:hypothetical protein RIF29_00354 [Crotalaria pallida]|uniref:F-box domain-containing protein n=1 Tax=Crotalaria pallida TaxID=3830 RepID=A0AAN9IVK4_CROPI
MHDIDMGQEGPILLRYKNKAKQNIQSGNKWTHLPSDILEMIMKRLKLIDYLGIQAVCSTWRAAITRAIANKHCHPLPELPLVFLTPRNKHVLPDMFFSLNTEQVCSLRRNNTLLERHHQCHGTVGGWMILSANLILGAKTIFFLNPVTNDVVMVPSPLYLPSESPIPKRSELRMGKMVASCSPKCEDCVVVGRFTDYAHIAYFRVHSDKSWTMIEAQEDTGYILEFEIFDDKLYVITNKLNDDMLVYDLQDSSDDPPKLKVLGQIPLIWPLHNLSRHDNQILVNGNVFYYLTRGQASEELLLIYLYHNFVFEAGNIGYMNIIKHYVRPPQITKCEVFKLDTGNDNKWVKLDHLGDRVIFLGLYNSLVMSRAALNSMEELVTENIVYFAGYSPCPKNPWLSTRLGKLCLTDNTIRYISLEQFGNKIDAIPYWFVPSPW